MNHPLPRLITFDGEARSGKGTIVQHTKDYLRDELGYKVMLIDAGQVFRVLGVGVVQAGVDVDDPEAIDAFLSDDAQAEKCVQLVKSIYHMDKEERDALIYTNQAGVNSAKMGARPKAQTFKDEILRKWYADAHTEGYEIILHDGRALEETGTMLEQEGLCRFVLGLYFVCDPVVGARRTLGFADTAYSELPADQKSEVDSLVQQINERNEKDHNRAVQPVVPPLNAPIFRLPSTGDPAKKDGRFMAIIDTSANMTKLRMTEPVAKMVEAILR